MSVPATYPMHLVERTRLADGATLILRPIRPDDAERVDRFVRELSPESRRFRFMHSLESLTPQMLADLTRIDYSRDMGLVALLDDGREPRPVGEACYFGNADGASAEFAIAVGDAVRGHGIGSRLMRTLMRAARGHRLLRLEGEVLADNPAMLRLMKALGFEMRRCSEDRHLVRVKLELGPADDVDDSRRPRAPRRARRAA